MVCLPVAGSAARACRAIYTIYITVRYNWRRLPDSAPPVAPAYIHYLLPVPTTLPQHRATFCLSRRRTVRAVPLPPVQLRLCVVVTGSCQPPLRWRGDAYRHAVYFISRLPAATPLYFAASYAAIAFCLAPFRWFAPTFVVGQHLPFAIYLARDGSAAQQPHCPSTGIDVPGSFLMTCACYFYLVPDLPTFFCRGDSAPGDLLPRHDDNMHSTTFVVPDDSLPGGGALNMAYGVTRKPPGSGSSFS